MPYIITTRRSYEQRPGANDLGQTIEQTTRRAVATLDEARTECVRIVASPALASKIADHGGTIGPLPDGTVIEVEQVDWIDFERLAREAAGTTGDLPPIETFDNDRYRAEIIDAYNEAQEH